MNRIFASMAGLTMLGIALTSGCSDDPPMTDEPTMEEYYAQATRLECEHMFACCESAEILKRMTDLGISSTPMNVDECASALMAQTNMYIDGYLRPKLTKGELVYDGSTAARCIASADTGNCAKGPNDYPECNAVFKGAVPLGGACSDPFDCIDAEASCQGTCIPNAKEGAACSATVRCISGLVCLTVNQMSTCVKPAANGAACATSLECDSVYCDPTGHCAPLRMIGETCADLGDCAMSYCDMATMKCVAFKKPGETCTTTDVCEAGLCDMTMQTCPPLAGPICDGK